MPTIRFSFVVFIASLSVALGAQTIDNDYQKLTLEQKVAKLFVADVSADAKLPAYQPLGLLSPKVPLGGGTGLPLKIADFTVSNEDAIHPAFPSPQVMAACNNKALLDKLMQSYFGMSPAVQGIAAGAFTQALDELHLGVDVPQPSTLLYFNNDVSVGPSASLAALIPLPASFLALKKSKSVMPVHGKDLAPLPKWELGVKGTGNIGFSFNDLLARPYLFKTSNLKHDLERVVRAFNDNEINKQLFESRVKWAMALTKNRNKANKVAPNPSAQTGHMLARRAVYESAVVLAKNGSNLLPLTDLRALQIVFCDFRDNKLQAYLQHVEFHCPTAIFSNEFGFFDNESSASNPKTVGVVLCDNLSQLPNVLIQLLKVKNAKPNVDWVLLWGGEVDAGALVANDYSVFGAVSMVFSHEPFAWECAVEALFGGVGYKGVSLHQLHGLSTKNVQQLVDPLRMKVGIPEEVGMDSKALGEINALVNEAIEMGAMPGAQVLVARNGVVVFHQNFGKTTYQGTDAVQSSHLYDIASVTKILSTTPVAMKLLDDKKLDLNQPLKNYLPETAETNKGAITISELLRHKSGLPPNMPTFYNFIDREALNGPVFNKVKSENYPTRVDERLYANKDIALRSALFSNQYSSRYSIHVAKDVFFDHDFSDSLYLAMLSAPLDKVKVYKYSDLGIGFLQKVLERVQGSTLGKLADSLFFSPMCLTSICFNPLSRFPERQIVPTENELLFRKQLLQGYVHDPAAALMGGVAGHAGLFANAPDVARMMQMYLNGGKYGDKQLISPQTVQLFTKRADASGRRGLGFDKPDSTSVSLSPVCEEASSQSFGHTGFTGTIAWADPQNGLVFVFLSNRIHPNVWNKRLMQLDIRAKCMSVAYRSVTDRK